MTAHQSFSSFSAACQIAAKLAETNATLDQVGQAPFAEVDVSPQSGLLKLLIPVEDDGLGGRWTDALEFTREIASDDGSNGQLSGYHGVGRSSQDLRFSVRSNQRRDAS